MAAGQRAEAGPRWRWTTVAAALGLALAGCQPAQAVPLPPHRPAATPVEPPLPPPRPPVQGPPAPPLFGPPMPDRRPPSPVAGSQQPAPPAATADAEHLCADLFMSHTVVARAIAPVDGPGGCGIAAPVELSAVTIGPGRQIGLAPPVTVNCPLARAFAGWVIEDLVPVFDKAGLPLSGLVDTSGYACRGRNRVVGAKISEHGFGDAIDIGGFASGKGTIGVKDSRAEVLGDIRRTACARFATVLGPGSDGYHESHMHVDLAPRRNGLKLCQWTLP